MTSGVQQHHGNQQRERDKSEREEQDEVPLMASWLGLPIRLGGQLRQIGGQDGKVVQGHCGERRGAALVELV
jgi:hypothetical protein